MRNRLAPRLLPGGCHRISGFIPGVHAARDAIHMLIAKFGQRCGGDVAPVAGLTIDDDMIVKGCADFRMALGHAPKINVPVGPGNNARPVFRRRADVNQEKRFLSEAGGFPEPLIQFMDGQLIGRMGRDGTSQHDQSEDNEMPCN